MDAQNGEEVIGRRRDVSDERMAALEQEVRVWSPASSAFWSLWGIVQAEEQIGGLISGDTQNIDFDYLVSTSLSEVDFEVS